MLSLKMTTVTTIDGHIIDLDSDMLKHRSGYKDVAKSCCCRASSTDLHILAEMIRNVPEFKNRFVKYMSTFNVSHMDNYNYVFSFVLYTMYRQKIYSNSNYLLLDESEYEPEIKNDKLRQKLCDIMYDEPLIKYAGNVYTGPETSIDDIVLEL